MRVTMQVEPTSNTALMCCVCGGFITDFAVVVADGTEPTTGLHKKCIEKLKVKRAKGEPS
jgi:hypothetical protein